MADQQKKKRSENWSTEEKDILRELITQSRHIIEDKSTRASSNIKKAQEWKNIAKKINELTGRYRSDGEVKLAWKRMKLSAKANLSAHRQYQMKTGGGEKPKSPSQEDLAIMDIAPHDFVVEYNDYDSDAIKTVVQLNPPEDNEQTAGPSTRFSPIFVEPPIIIESPPEFNDEVEVLMDQGTTKVNMGNNTPRKKENIRRKQSGKKGPQNIKEAMQESILKSNNEFKKRQLQMLEVEHQYNVKIAKLQIKKLELEIELLENRKNSST